MRSQEHIAEVNVFIKYITFFSIHYISVKKVYIHTSEQLVTLE